MSERVGFGIKNCAGVGPWLYIERGGFMLHFAARYFWLPWYRGFRCCLHVRVGGYRKVWARSVTTSECHRTVTR